MGDYFLNGNMYIWISFGDLIWNLSKSSDRSYLFWKTTFIIETDRFGLFWVTLIGLSHQKQIDSAFYGRPLYQYRYSWSNEQYDF